MSPAIPVNSEAAELSHPVKNASFSPPPNILSLSSLSLHHFRNYASARLQTGSAPVVLTGHNGAGKTNILEALSLLVPGRGLRRARLGEIDYKNPCLSGEGNTSWVISAHVNGMQGAVKIGTGRDASASSDSDKRLVRIDEKPARSQAELARHLSIIWLTPQMEQLFQEGASAGRKFLDRLVYAFDSDHAGRINEYEYAMRERNRLLPMGAYDSAWVDSLERTMAETAAAIASARIDTVAHINHAILASSLSFPKAEIAVVGEVENRLLQGESAAQAEAAFQEKLAANRVQDAAAGRALIGAHRSEMRVFHRAKAMPAESCSMGEQKAILLSIMLAQGRACALWKGVVPMLLLDEVVNHLDPTRRLELFEEICQIGAQTWMTGTDADLFDYLRGKAQFFTVENAAIG